MKSTSLPNPVDELTSAFVRATGKDGISYAVMPLMWTVDAMYDYAQKFEKFKILPDNVPHGLGGFQQFVINSRALWFEIVNEETGVAVGIIFLDDFVPSPLENRFLSASYHVSVWDSKFIERIPVHTAFVRAIFAQFGLHRLETEIPLYAGGAIRVAMKAGFVSEGTRRKVRFYKGQWFDAAFLSILETEVP